MPLQATSGAASYDGFGGGVAAVPQYIEDVFSTYLFTGNGTTQTVTNGIDLIGKGGMVWRKQRDATANHFLADTVRGTYSTLSSNTTAAASGSSYIDFLSDGFQAVNSGSSNPSGALQASWTFREQPKFFDVVTYTGNGSTQSVAHSLGSTPGCIMVKRTDSTSQWTVYHRGLSSPNLSILVLNSTAAADADVSFWNNTAPTSTNFTVGNAGGVTNTNGATYVAYLFAHNAGGFGLTGTDNVISCGSFTTSTVPDTITLGYEPQWVLIKSASSATNWYIFDNMRGIPTGGLDSRLMPNLSAAESTDANYLDLTATGFTSNFQSIFGDGINLIYIAIRRGPMKVPTLGTSVFSPAYASTNTSPTKITTGFPVDMQINSYLNGTGTNQPVLSRLQGVSSNTTESGVYLQTAATAAESPSPAYSLGWDNTGFRQFSYYDGAKSGFWNFGRAPGFFDVVCYTGTGSATTFTHNLTVVPELMIVKSRTVANSWLVYISALGPTKTLTLNAVSKEATSATAWNNTAPTASVFTIGSAAAINTAASTNVAYLFATLAGVSKVGSYTGTGATQTINCGFTGGARFVLIKRTDNPGAWYVWDTARGMVSGTDPSLRLNSTAAEVNANSVYTITTGFQIVTTVDDINTAGGEYIFLAIA